MGKVLDWDNKHFFLYIDNSHILLNQFIFCAEEVVVTLV